jgi:hypothetical protein
VKHFLKKPGHRPNKISLASIKLMLLTTSKLRFVTYECRCPQKQIKYWFIKCVKLNVSKKKFISDLLFKKMKS